MFTEIEIELLVEAGVTHCFQQHVEYLSYHIPYHVSYQVCGEKCSFIFNHLVVQQHLSLCFKETQQHGGKCFGAPAADCKKKERCKM